MGYDLHITRKEDWYDEEPNNDISLEEWLAYIHSAGSELELSDAYWVKVPGSETESQVAPGFCKWTAHPSDERPYFDYFVGVSAQRILMTQPQEKCCLWPAN